MNKLNVIWLFVSLCACRSHEDISISIDLGDENESPVGQKERVFISNNTSDVFHYTVGMEFKTKGEWWEMVDDIENPSNEFAFVHTLEPDTTISLTFNAEEIIHSQLEFGEIDSARVFVRYSRSMEDKEFDLKNVSEVFRLE